MSAKIYQPTKNAMQSGKGNTKYWLLEYQGGCTRYTDPVMGWNGNADTQQQLRMKFPTRDAAVNYAKKNKLDYQVVEPRVRKTILQSYSENFTQ